MNGTPTDLNGGGYAVRVRCAGGGISHTSGRMTKAEAEIAAGQFESKVARVQAEIAASQAAPSNPVNPFVRFQGQMGEVRLRAERVTTIEILDPFQSGLPFDRLRETRPVVGMGETR